MRRAWLGLLLVGCYVEAGAGLVGGWADPVGEAAGPAFTLAAGVFLEQPDNVWAGGAGLGGDYANLALDDLAELAVAFNGFGFVDVTLSHLEEEEDEDSNRFLLRWSSGASIGGGGVRTRLGANEAAMLTLFSGPGLTFLSPTDHVFVTVAAGPYVMLTTNPAALLGGQVRVRFGFWLADD